MATAIDDFGKRIDDMKDWIKAEFGRVHDRLDRVEKTLGKLDACQGARRR
jgi:hypothetical protein